ncbi:MAG: winged helix-turn-helix domain-containing protein, partial [Acetivibrio sp.]
MNINLQNENIPIYLDVYNSLYSDIKNGVYLPNELLPGEIQLAEKYKVSRNTLRQALAI